MEQGDFVRVTQYGGEKLTRRVVSDWGETVIVCNEKEYLAAHNDGREPQGVGFPREYVEEIDRQN